MSHTRMKVKGRADSRSKRFALIPAEVIYSTNWRQASKTCRALVADIAVQYNSHNNGDLTASMSVMRKLGWTSGCTLDETLKEAQHYGFLEQTRQGGLLVGASLLALGWRPIDACIDRKTGSSKLDDPSMVGVTPRRWQVPQSKFQRPRRKKSAYPRGGAISRSSPRVADKDRTAWRSDGALK